MIPKAIENLHPCNHYFPVSLTYCKNFFEIFHKKFLSTNFPNAFINVDSLCVAQNYYHHIESHQDKFQVPVAIAILIIFVTFEITF